nr:collagen alpha-1(I) chain-like [Macaca nemestrina]
MVPEAGGSLGVGRSPGAGLLPPEVLPVLDTQPSPREEASRGRRSGRALLPASLHGLRKVKVPDGGQEVALPGPGPQGDRGGAGAVPELLPSAKTAAVSGAGGGSPRRAARSPDPAGEQPRRLSLPPLRGRRGGCAWGWWRRCRWGPGGGGGLGPNVPAADASPPCLKINLRPTPGSGAKLNDLGLHKARGARGVCTRNGHRVTRPPQPGRGACSAWMWLELRPGARGGGPGLSAAPPAPAEPKVTRSLFPRGRRHPGAGAFLPSHGPARPSRRPDPRPDPLVLPTCCGLSGCRGGRAALLETDALRSRRRGPALHSRGQRPSWEPVINRLRGCGAGRYRLDSTRVAEPEDTFLFP